MRSPSSLVVSVCALSTACEGEPSLSVLDPKLAATPTSIRFEPTPVGLARHAPFRLAETGGGPALDIEAELVPSERSPFSAKVPEEIAGGVAVDLEVTFAPTLSQEFRAILTIRGSSFETLEIPVEGLGLQAPNCDDENPCTDDQPTLDESCTHHIRTGPCDDRNACTESEECFDGRCVGAAVACQAESDCFVALCDFERGCVQLAEPGSCDDDDPCTIDRCTADGCDSEAAPNGYPCGGFAQCELVHICVLGECIEAAVPESTPCSDGDVCTEADRCVTRRCQGERVARPAEISGFARTFGVRGAIGAIVSDGRLVILDPLEGERGSIATVLTRTGSSARVSSQEILPTLVNRGRSSLSSMGENLLVYSDDSGGIKLLSLEPASTVHLISELADTLPMPGMDRAPLAAFQRVVYTCTLGSSELFVINADRPENPSVSSLGLPAPCAGVAVDPVHARLFVSGFAEGGGGIARFDLDPLGNPDFVDRVLLGTGYRMASNGKVLALAEAGPFATSELVQILDIVDFTSRSELDPLDLYFTHSFGDLVFAGDRLFVQTKTGLTSWDVTNPESPALEASFERSGVGNGSNAPPVGAVVTDGRTLFRAGDPVFGEFPLLVEVSGAPTSIEHPFRGGADRLFKSGERVFAFDVRSIHGLESSVPDSPAFSSGSTTPALAAASLWAFGDSGGAPVALAARTWPGVFTSAYSAITRDGRDPDAPIALGAPFTPFSSGVAHVVDDQSRAVRLGISFDGTEAWVSTHRLDDSTRADLTSGLTELARVPLPVHATLDPNHATVAARGDRVVAVTEGRLANPFDTSVVADSRVFVIRLGPNEPTIEASSEVLGHVTGAGIDGDRIVLGVKTSGSLCCGPFQGEVVRYVSVVGNQLVTRGEVAAPYSSGALSIDGDKAIAGTSAGALFLALEESGPRILGSVGLADSPTSAVVVGERVWFAGPHGVTSVRWPCEF
ncbi:MAG: DUF753 domain-containing protein [Deltaproteobacteria bacterium]|nr:DUF753 domain-containing protein [Deltaproteobacteria bacterium]